MIWESNLSKVLTGSGALNPVLLKAGAVKCCELRITSS